MLPKTFHDAERDRSPKRVVWITFLIVFASAHIALGQQQCPFTTCGDGSDGALNYTGQSGSCGTIPNCVYFDPVALGLHGTGDAFCVYNFTSITIPAGLTVLLTANKVNCPVYWLSQGDVNVSGTVNLAGQSGAPMTQDAAVRIPAVPGSGGFPGGIGGNTATNQNATAGGGPGGGAAGSTSSGNAGGGTFSGNQFLAPLVGGSGGGGTNTSGQFGEGGGAGGGAILIASSTQISVTGIITADAGLGLLSGIDVQSGPGSGGGIRLVSLTITGTGIISADGDSGSSRSPSTAGYARLEATTISFTGGFDDTQGNALVFTKVAESSPLPLLTPTTVPPSVQVTSINGVKIKENPFSFPDITINTTSPVPVVITGHQVPVGTVPTLYIFSETQDQQALPCTGGLVGTLANSTCTMNITYPYADSRGFVKATWSASPP